MNLKPYAMPVIHYPKPRDIALLRKQGDYRTTSIIMTEDDENVFLQGFDGIIAFVQKNKVTQGGLAAYFDIWYEKGFPMEWPQLFHACYVNLAEDDESPKDWWND